ncbi:MAG: arginine decarboxylase, partial [Candidatus Eisenbacteria bacterium]|nr:arginine decarboxylase [Candidatus Eisenbacteria bacterium]
LRASYVANFSVFRSIPDAWAVQQLFPVMPIHRLDEEPDELGILMDLTCDSDGKIDRFVDPQRLKPGLELHSTRMGEPYVLAVLLVGAYQEVLGNSHNLLGRPDELSVTVEKGGALELEARPTPDRIDGIVRAAGWDPDELEAAARRGLAGAGRSQSERARLESELKRLRKGSSYLSN